MTEPSGPKDSKGGQPLPFFARLVATGFFSGYSPVAPGTAGSLVGLALYLIPGFEDPWVSSSLIVIVFFIGTISAAVLERLIGEDPSIVVVDEIVGMWVSLFLLPKTLPVMGVSFLLFRLYDIVKPPPARQLERARNGWGIMLDDVAAGLYANLTVRVLRMFILP